MGYWQQHVHYRIVARLDEAATRLHSRGELVYVNNSPDTLREMYLQQYLNAFRPGSRWSAADEREGRVRFQRLQDPDYAFRVFDHHYKLSGIGGRFTGLEMGPGDSLFSALMAKTFGATHCYLVDSGDFASSEVERYRAMASYLRAKGLSPPDLANARSRDDVLSACGSTYRTDGLSGYRAIPDASVEGRRHFRFTILAGQHGVQFLPLLRR